jgi:hypothetical protein
VTRLKSTRAIFMAKMETNTRLLYKTKNRLKEEDVTLNRLRGNILRASAPKTIEKYQNQLELIAKELGYHVPKKRDKQELLRTIENFKRQNSFVEYVALEYACIHLCTILEDLVKRIILKYYEEDVMRLKSEKQTINNEELVDLLLTGLNIHRALAEKITADSVYGITKWTKALNESVGIKFSLSSPVEELFLVRNCLVHNDKKVSKELHTKFQEIYRGINKKIELNIEDYEKFREAVHRFAVFLIKQYSINHPINKGTWLGWVDD